MTQSTVLAESPVLSREVLHMGAVVSIKLPKTLKPGQITQADGNIINYLQYPIMLRGGKVNIFVISNDAGLAGKSINARVTITVKTMREGGRKFAYVDLQPVVDAEPTHKLFVLTQQHQDLPHWLTFDTPGMEGFIALGALGDKAELRAVTDVPAPPIVSAQRRALQPAPVIPGNRPFADALAGLKL